jgi:hypothetical protein
MLLSGKHFTRLFLKSIIRLLGNQLFNPESICCRWERIAELMERHAWEVTKMAGRIKANPSLLPAKQGVTGRSVVREIDGRWFSSDRLQ